MHHVHKEVIMGLFFDDPDEDKDSKDSKDSKDRSDNGHGQEKWTEVMGGCDQDGNPVTVQFGVGEKEGETRLGDGDRSEINFRDSANHDHYGKGDGPNDNGTTRGQYTGYGSD